MKSRIAILLAAAALCPSLAYAAEGAEPEGSWFSLIFYVINFVLFLWVVKYYGGARISGFFHDRAKTIRETISRAEKALKDAQDLANTAAERMAGLEAEKAKIASDLADETVYQIGRIYDIAQETVARIKRDSELTVAALRESGQRRLRETMAAAAGRIAREILARNFEPGDQRRLIEGFVDKLGEEARR
jgi:F0F1-type ATP synthase membrane subunit b/b'